jgi:hypothetical protein
MVMLIRAFLQSSVLRAPAIVVRLAHTF